MRFITKILVISILCLLPLNIAFAAEKQEKQDTTWNSDNTGVFSKGFENQKAVSDNKLKKTIEQVKECSLSAKQRKLKEQMKPLSPAYDEEHFKNFADENDSQSELKKSHTVMIPTSVYGDDGTVIPPGYYKLSCRKTGDNVYVLDLSQGTRLVLSVNAVQTKQDLEQDSINFCNAEIIDGNRVRLMYGSIELNLVGYLYFK